MNGHPSVLRLSSVQLGAFDASQKKGLDDLDGYSDIHRVSNGDLLITRASGSLDRVGYVALASNVEPDTYIPDLIWRLAPKDGVCLPEFLMHLLASAEYRSRVIATARGTASMRKINQRNFSLITIPVPPLEQQYVYLSTCNVASTLVEALRSERTFLSAARSTLLSYLLDQRVEIPTSYDRFLEKVA